MKWPFILVIIILILLLLKTNTHKNKNKVPTNKVNTKKKAICFLSASFSDKLYEFVKELAKDDTKRDYDFYI